MKTTGYLVGALASGLFASDAAAEGWEYTIAPYLWGAGLSGEVATLPPAPPAEVDLSFGDVLESLEFATMIVLHARNGPWAITADLQFVQTATDAETPGGNFSGGRLRSKTTSASLLGEHRISESDRHLVWAGLGIRYWNVDTELDLRAGTQPGRDVSESDSWIDPIVGMRGLYELTERSYISGWLYAGGFGAGSDSMADVFGGYGYRFTETTSGVLGYRWLAVDRENGDFLYDVEQQGLIAGLRFDF